MSIRSLLVILFAMLPFQNCGEFNAVGNSGLSSFSNPSFFKCSSGDLRNPQASPLKRLNKFELKNTIEDLLGRYLTSAEVLSLMTSIQPEFDAIPNEISESSMNHFDQSMSAEHIDKQIVLAEKIAELIMGSVNFRNKIVGACAQNESDTNCRDQFISRFGELAYRRPLSGDDITWYRQVYDGESNHYENLIAALLSSPYFIYHYEAGSRDISSPEQEVVSLDAFESASKLSYLYLQSMPDSELFESARNKSILTSEGLKVQVKRLLADAKVQKRLTHFLSEQLYELEETPFFDTNISAVNSMISGLSVTESLEKRREHMINEIFDFMNYIVWEKRGGFRDLMTSNVVFPKTQDLAEIYGTAVWNGGLTDSELVRAPAGERPGILTRAQSLFTGMTSTRPILRGAKIYNDFLCGELPVPADTGVPEGVLLEDHFSEREKITAMTEHPGSSCLGCHGSIINPLGFPFETYDSFGRFRQNENIYHPEESPDKGNILTTKPVDSETSISFGGTIDASFSNANSVAEELAGNERAMACFSLKLWNFVSKQPYKIGENDCATASIYKKLVESDSIYETLENIPFQPEFFKRTIQ